MIQEKHFLFCKQILLCSICSLVQRDNKTATVLLSYLQNNL